MESNGNTKQSILFFDRELRDLSHENRLERVVTAIETGELVVLDRDSITLEELTGGWFTATSKRVG